MKKILLAVLITIATLLAPSVSLAQATIINFGSSIFVDFGNNPELGGQIDLVADPSQASSGLIYFEPWTSGASKTTGYIVQARSGRYYANIPVAPKWSPNYSPCGTILIDVPSAHDKWAYTPIGGYSDVPNQRAWFLVNLYANPWDNYNSFCFPQ
jgi:hypothetical protein